ncbi:MAG: HAD-IIA family hydrolase [Fimbriimonadaceae bacterium]
MPPYSLYIFDLDGTLYRGDSPVPEAVAAVARLRAAHKEVRFLTNNSGATVENVAHKLRRLGYQADPSEIETSATGTAAFLKSEGIQSAQCVGEPGLVETLRRAGLRAEGPDDTWAAPAEAVVAGICRQFTYALLTKAMTAVRAGARFVATNADATYPVEGDGLIPGAGSIVAAIRTASETEPYVVGKPSAFLTRIVLKKAGVAPDETLVVGDRMDTDIESGDAAGCDTLLVLTGVTQEAPPGQRWATTLADL